MGLDGRMFDHGRHTRSPDTLGWYYDREENVAFRMRLCDVLSRGKARTDKERRERNAREYAVYRRYVQCDSGLEAKQKVVTEQQKRIRELEDTLAQASRQVSGIPPQIEKEREALQWALTALKQELERVGEEG